MPVTATCIATSPRPQSAGNEDQQVVGDRVGNTPADFATDLHLAEAQGRERVSSEAGFAERAYCRQCCQEQFRT